MSLSHAVEQHLNTARRAVPLRQLNILLCQCRSVWSFNFHRVLSAPSFSVLHLHYMDPRQLYWLLVIIQTVSHTERFFLCPRRRYGGIRNCCDRPSVCLSICPMPLALKQCIYGYGYCRTLIGNRICWKSNASKWQRNCKEAVAGAASEAFAMCLHARRSAVGGHIVSPRDTSLCV